MRSEGVEIALLDCTSEEDVQCICAAIPDLSLISGSSALAAHLPATWERGQPIYPKRQSGGRGILVVSSGHEQHIRRQNAWLAAHQAVAITLKAADLAAGRMPDTVFTPICDQLASGGACLLQTSLDAHAESTEAIAHSLGVFVRDIMSLITPEGLILSGAETATVLSRVLGFGALAVGPSIEPGIPVCVTLAASGLPVVLKSGHFGSDSFYGNAIQAIRHLEYQDDSLFKAQHV